VVREAIARRLGVLAAEPIVRVGVVALLVFALWEVVNHVLLMEILRLPMVTYHLVSVVVEAAGAGAVAFLVIRVLVRKNRQLVELDRQKALLADSVVHDLRQPLTALLGGLQTAIQYGSLADETRRLVYLAQLGGVQLLATVDDLLDIARLEAGQEVIAAEAVRPADFIAAGVQDVAQIAWDREVALTADVSEDLPLVNADPRRVRRVVMNLVDNALKFTPSGGRVCVGAVVDPKQKQVVVSISDTGPGIPEEYRERIFERFVALDRRTASGRVPTGLGLAFCKMMVAAHGGRIWVEGEPEGGSTFAFTLPAAQRRAA
jgi:signal transduction histidine kinase